jgi:hypothetical protein
VGCSVENESSEKRRDRSWRRKPDGVSHLCHTADQQVVRPAGLEPAIYWFVVRMRKVNHDRLMMMKMRHLNKLRRSGVEHRSPYLTVERHLPRGLRHISRHSPTVAGTLIRPAQDRPSRGVPCSSAWRSPAPFSPPVTNGIDVLSHSRRTAGAVESRSSPRRRAE